MKMMKLIIPVLALTAWASAASAVTPKPAIYEIKACGADGSELDNQGNYIDDNPSTAKPNGGVCTAETPITVGDIYFMIRLYNPDYNATTRTASQKWKLHYSGSSGVEDMDWATIRPGVGIIVSGQTKKAEFQEIVEDPDGLGRYSDIIFKYTVQPGDIALPIRLAKDLYGNSVADSGSSIYWYNPTTWQIRGWDGSAYTDTEAVLKFQKYTPTPYQVHADAPGRSNNFDMYDSRIYVRTLDFAEAEASYSDGKKYLSIVSENTSNCSPIPSIVINSAASSVSFDGTPTLYVWTSDDTIAEVVKSGDAVKAVEDVEMPKLEDSLVSNTCKVATIELSTGNNEYKFKVQAKVGQQDKKVTVYLSQHKGFYTRGSGGAVMEDYITAEIMVGPKPAPNISITGKDSLTVGADYKNAIGTLKVVTSEVYPATDGSKLKVKIEPQFSDGTTDGIFHYVHIADTDDGSTSWNTDTAYEFLLEGGIDVNLEKTLYVFGLGANAKTVDPNGVQFVVTVSDGGGAVTGDTTYYALPSPMLVTLVPAKPQLTLDTEDPTKPLTVVATKDLEFPILIADNRKNILSGGYKLEYKLDESASAWTVLDTSDNTDKTWYYDSMTGRLVDKNNAMPKLNEYTDRDDSYHTLFRVTAPKDALTDSDVISQTLSVEVKVSAAPKMWAEVLDAGSYVTGGAFDEGTNTQVRVVLSEAYTKDVYAFLAPVDPAAAANIVSGEMLTNTTGAVGLKIEKNNTESKEGTLTFLDGTSATTKVRFAVVLCDSSTYDANKVNGYYNLKNDLDITVNNVAPAVTSVTIGGMELVPGSGTDTITVPIDVSKTFEVAVKDVTQDKTSAFKVDWSIILNDGEPPSKLSAMSANNSWTDDNTNTFPLKGDPADPDETGYKHLKTSPRKLGINEPGKHVMTVIVTDKDGASGTYSFNINVTGAPEVTLVKDSKPLGEIGEIGEDTVDDQYFRVKLSESAKQALKVRLTVTAGTTNSNKGKLLLDLTREIDPSTGDEYGDDNGDGAQYLVTIPAYSTVSDEIYFKEFDGTKYRWTIKAELDASNGTGDPTGTGWQNYFVSQTCKMKIMNIDPVFTCDLGEENTSSNAFRTAIGDYPTAIGFSIDDIDADLAWDWSGTPTAPSGDVGVKVTWTSPGRKETIYIDKANKDTKTFKPNFKSSGKDQVVTVSWQDKDGAIQQLTWHFDVEASKTLTTMAHGPGAGVASALSQHYASATGLGHGRVWANGTIGEGGEFSIAWNMGLQSSAIVRALGYNISTRKTADKTWGEKQGITADGGVAAATATTGFYDYTSAAAVAKGGDTERDSFLYAYLVTSTDQSGTQTSALYNSTISPERSSGSVAAIVPLPTEPNGDGNYSDVVVEAVFSKEWRPSDNCGDINSDGIPDVALIQYGFGVYDTEELTFNASKDTADLSLWNEDYDFMPASAQMPGATNSWQKDSQAFTARLEIRGYGLGLNNDSTDKNGVSANVNLSGIYNDPANPDWSEFETNAWWSAGAPVDASGNPDWSPERPTDPTKADTDGDGLPDGYEYYFWYRAHVGDPDLDEWKKGKKVQKLFGRKFDLEHPEDEGAMIDSATIEKYFDPLVRTEDKTAMERDLDGDGLTDYEEFVIGTSPIFWDSDGDGISDFWEVRYASKLNPLKHSTDDSNPDGKRNDDKDFMAQATLSMYYIGTIDSNGRTVYYGATGDSITNFIDSATAGTTKTGIGFTVGSTQYVYTGTKALAALVADVDTDGDSVTDAQYLKEAIQASECYALNTSGYVVGTADFDRGTKVTAVIATQNYDYYTFDPLAPGAAKGTNEFGPSRTYLLWMYGREKSVDGKRLAMGREDSIPPGNIVPATYITLGSTPGTVLLNHWQVYQWRGFELDPLKDMGTGFCPTTAWNAPKDGGYVAARWKEFAHNASVSLDLSEQFRLNNFAGKAQDTVEFGALDEFLVDAFFRYATGQGPALATFNSNPNIGAYYSRYTTLPQNQTDEDGNVTAYGADSDADGVPDGWELYVQCGPGTLDTKRFKWDYKDTAYNEDGDGVGATAYSGPLGPRYNRGSWDSSTSAVSRDWISMSEMLDDGLTEAAEFWGTDSTAAYADVPSIAAVTEKLQLEWWLNKFWPTDPWSCDTDCDGIYDGNESAFRYKTAPEDDGKSWCFPGGGTNPCACDTDRDGLPDVWEMSYRGVRLPVVDDTDLDLINSERLLNALADYGYTGTNDTIAVGCYGGMDPTVKDSFTGIVGGTGHNCDYDYDGLQNWQEYLTSTIRAFRYDDTTSPWTGFDLAGKQTGRDNVDNDTTTPFNYSIFDPGAATDLDGDSVISMDEYMAYGALVATNTISAANNTLGLTYPVQEEPMSPSASDYPLNILDPDYYEALGAYDVRKELYEAWSKARAAVTADWIEGTLGDTVNYPLNPIFRQGDFGKIAGAGINPGTICGMVDAVSAYGTVCRRDWDINKDAVYFYPDGPNHALKRGNGISSNEWKQASLELKGIIRPVNAYEQRIMDASADTTLALAGLKEQVVQNGYPHSYCGTSPVDSDSDGDGMDDYYELFHGLNPMYGGAGGKDLISQTWGGANSVVVKTMTTSSSTEITAENNFWTYYLNNSMTVSDADKMDFVKFPWMNGSAAADPDGDDIRNQYEALKPEMQASATYLHTDPTPLWMTDTSYTNSIVSTSYATVRKSAALIEDEANSENHWSVLSGYNWAFEENEGFDTDNDWYNDFREAQRGTDAQNADSPVRRQAMYFPGGGFGAVQVKDDILMSSLINGGKAEQQLTYFTVECWARPENATGGKQVLVERMISDRASNPGDQWYLRRNFQLGIDANGYWYAAFDNDGTGDTAKHAVTVVAVSKAVNNVWTHVAATYDGAALRLYIDGALAGTQATTLKPATGALETRTLMEKYTQSIPWNAHINLERIIYTYITDEAPVRSIVMGAGIKGAAGDSEVSSMAIDEYTNAKDYAFCYKGYLDEVRIWDGARTSAEIADNYLTRMTQEDIAANRDEIYDGIQAGKSRAVNPNGNLPAELLYHYAFDNIAAGATAAEVAQAPFGMATTSAADRRYTKSVPDKWQSPGWTNISITAVANAGTATGTDARSSVYGKEAYSVVPWIRNTVAQLPAYDGTVVDSVYWKEGFAARTPASELGRSKFTFANSSSPYNHVRPVSTGSARSHTDTTDYLYYQVDEANGSNYTAMRDFKKRADSLLNTDALPLGNAYAKYVEDMWDGQGASTTSEVTGKDADNNGVADWADAVLGSGGMSLSATLTYNGTTDTVAGHYARLLANGAHGVTGTETTAKGDNLYRQTADFNSSGLPDWWEDLYQLSGSGLEDDDNDGLSNYTEYLLSEVFNTGKRFNPTLAQSIDQYTLDYFFKIGKLYVGEIFTDHDMVEDVWEDQYPKDYASRINYDANLDNDNDGWQMRSEARYSSMVRPITANEITHLDEYQESLRDYPVPTLELTVNYNGDDARNVEAADLVVYVKAVDSSADFDAKFILPAGTNSSWDVYTEKFQLLGSWRDSHTVGTLSPGNVSPTGLAIKGTQRASAMVYHWSVQHVDRYGIHYWTSKSGTLAEYYKDIRLLGLSNVEMDDKSSAFSDMEGFDYKYDEERNDITVSYEGTLVGVIDCSSGEYDLNLGALAGKTTVLSGDDTESTNATTSVEMEMLKYGLQYTAVPRDGIPRKVYLGVPDSGAVKEGRNNVIVVADMNGDGLYTPGEPFGFTPGVEVGWRRGLASVTLTETSPISIRMDLTTGDNDRKESWGDWADIEKEDLDTSASESDFGKYVRMRVVRAYCNGIDQGSAALAKPVIDRKVYLNSEISKFLTEADFITQDVPDVDWADGAGLASASINGTNVRYRIVFGNDALTSNASLSNTGKYMFDRRFDSNDQRARVTIVAPGTNQDFVVTATSPTFVWKMDPVSRDTYTAFRVVMTGAGGFKYDSGVQLAPPKNAAGEYVWTAPISVTDKLAGNKFTGDTSTGTFANGAYYGYTLYMYNTKFQTDANGGDGRFFINVPMENPTFGTIAAKVRYLGPNTTAAAGTVYGGKTVRLQAFTTPDFTGTPAASTVVDPAAIGTANDTMTANAKLIGLSAGTYYLRAFIDSNDNGVCDDWESMGYLCARGTADAASIYNPTGVRFSPDTLGAGTEVEIYIEDADTNQNTVPDAWEYYTNKSVSMAPTLIADATKKLGITFNTNVGQNITTNTPAGSIPAGMAGRILLALGNPAVAALTMGYDTLEEAEAAAATLDEDASVVAITSMSTDGTKVTVNYTTEVGTEMGASTVGSPFYVASGDAFSFTLVVKTKANMADAEWTTAEERTVTLSLNGENTGTETVDLGAAAEDAGFVKIELK